MKRRGASGRVVLLMAGVVSLALSTVGPKFGVATPNDVATTQFGPYTVPADPTPALCAEHGLSYTPENTWTGTVGADVKFLGNEGQLALALDGKDFVSGGNAKDCIDGGPGKDVLKGGTGKDVILGGPDDDALFGGNGKDVLDGGDGYDICIGGNGTDTFIDCEIQIEGNGGEPGDECGDDFDAGSFAAGAGGGGDDDDDDCDEDEGDECDGRDFSGLSGGAGGGHDDDDDCDGDEGEGEGCEEHEFGSKKKDKDDDCDDERPGANTFTVDTGEVPAGEAQEPVAESVAAEDGDAQEPGAAPEDESSDDKPLDLEGEDPAPDPGDKPDGAGSDGDGGPAAKDEDEEPVVDGPLDDDAVDEEEDEAAPGLAGASKPRVPSTGGGPLVGISIAQ